MSELGRFEVKLLERHNEDLPDPADALPFVFQTLAQGMITASGYLGDIGTSYFTTPTCYPEREVEGEERESGIGEVVTLLRLLFDQMVERFPDQARGHVLTWPRSDKYFFRKLVLYALSKPTLFSSDDVVAALMALEQPDFWDMDVARELLFLLADRWPVFTAEQQAELGERLLTGPDQSAHWTDEEYPSIRDEIAARYARYLQLNGCALNAEQSSRVVELTSAIENWNDGWATSTVTERGFTGGFVQTDERPDVIINLPVDEVVQRAKQNLRRDFGSLTDLRPFTGLVKAKPTKALSALTVASKANDYPKEFWTALINEMPNDISPRLQRVLLIRLTRLPDTVVQDLRHTLGRWVEQNIERILDFDADLGWATFDHIVDGIVRGGESAAESGLGEVHIGGEATQRSRRTFGHAINGPLGMCVEALYHAIPGEGSVLNSVYLARSMRFQILKRRSARRTLWRTGCVRQTIL